MVDNPWSERHRSTERSNADPTVYGPRFGGPAHSDLPDENLIKTGTTLVALTTAEGVVMATDRRASAAGRFVLSKNARKVERVHPTAALAISGAVSPAQTLIENLRSEVSLYEIERDKRMSMQALSTLTANLLKSGSFLGVVPILGGIDDDGHHVYDFDGAGGVSDEPYVAGGSGMPLAYGALEDEYESGLSNSDGIRVATRAVRSAVERDTASGNGLNLAEITAEGVEIETYDEFEAVLDSSRT